MHWEKLYRSNYDGKENIFNYAKISIFFRIYLHWSINTDENLLNNHIDDEKDCVISIIST